MGSGCNNSSSGNFFEKLTPDTGVLYTGQPIPALGICTGDRLNEVEAVLLQKIIDYSTGVGISIPNIDLSTCDAFKDCIVGCCSACTDLPCLLECYKNTICTIWGDVETLKDEVNTLVNGPYNVTCLNISSTSKLNVIIQQLIDEFCALKTAVSALEGTVNSFVSGINTTIGKFLTNAISSCQGVNVLKVTNPNTANVQFAFKGFVPIGGIMPWGGDTAGKFDSTGLGLPNTDWCGWAICNGLNGTPNMLGLIPVMATDISGSVPPIGYRSFPYGSIGGEYYHTLTGPESGVAAHGHGVNDPGHDHFLRFKNWKFNRNGLGSTGGDNYTDLTGGIGTTSPDYTGWAGSGGIGFTTDGTPVTGKIGTSGTGISVSGANDQNAKIGHNNVQPYIALYYIQRVN